MIQGDLVIFSSRKTDKCTFTNLHNSSLDGATAGKSPGVKSLSAHFGGVFKKSRPRPEKTPSVSGSKDKPDAPVGNSIQPEIPKEPEKAPKKSPKLSSRKAKDYSSDDSKEWWIFLSTFLFMNRS